MMSIDKGQYYGINAVGSRIWQLLETPQTVVALCERLCEEFVVDAATCERDVQNFVDALIENGVVRTC